MNSFRKIFFNSFLSTGPLIVSFGTFSGLILFLRTFVANVSDSSFWWIYLIYIAFLYSVGIFFEFKSFAVVSDRVQNSADLDVEVVGRRGPLSFVGSWQGFLLGGVSNFIEVSLKNRGIQFLDVFRKPDYWTTEFVDFKDYPIIRMLKNGDSFEIRFKKGKKGVVYVRTADRENHSFGEFSEQRITSWPELFLIAPLATIVQIVKG